MRQRVAMGGPHWYMRSGVEITCLSGISWSITPTLLLRTRKAERQWIMQSPPPISKLCSWSTVGRVKGNGHIRHRPLEQTVRRVYLSATPFVVFAILLFSGATCLGQAPPPKSGRPQTSRPKVPPKEEPQEVTEPAAQAPSGPQWVSISVVRVKPDMVNEWLDLNKNTVIPALRKAGVKSRDAWLTAQFGEAFEYLFVTPVESLAQYDGESPVRKGLGEEGYQAYLEKARRMVTSVHTTAARARKDLSYEGKTSWPPKLIVVATIQVAQ